ncbi:MAG: RhuM family protein, partial [Bacteroidia bacterium]|nr:RhuM family protein [Bacteroidia bacterium]
QNKLLFAVTGKTAAELIVSRAHADAPNMGLTSWQGSVVRKQDITIAKNYLTHDEIDTLNRLVVIFLESAELRAQNRQDLTMNFWRENVDRMLVFQDKQVLRGPGRMSNAYMEEQVRRVYAEFDQHRKLTDSQEADVQDMDELKALEEEIKKKNP